MDLERHAKATDGELVCRSFGCTIKGLDEKARTVDVIMSTDTIDRAGEKVEQDWDLGPFSKNPIVLFAHSTYELPIGRAEHVRVVGGALNGTIRFASEKANPMAEQCFQLFREGVLNAVSVGFISHKYSYEESAGKEVLVMSQNELVELSVTSTPCNPDALAKMHAKALAQSKQTSPAIAPPAVPQPAQGGQSEKFNMDLEQKIKDLEAERAKAAETHNATAKALESEKAKTLELTEKVKLSETATATEKDRADKAETRAKTAEELVVKAGVDALIGKKITPAESEEFYELAVKHPELYAKMIAKRADLPTAVNTVVVTAEKGTPAPIVPDAGNGEELAARIDKRRNYLPLESDGATDEE